MATETVAMEHVEALVHCLGLDPRCVAHMDIEPWGINVQLYDRDDEGKLKTELDGFGGFKPIIIHKHFPVAMSMEGLRST